MPPNRNTNAPKKYTAALKNLIFAWHLQWRFTIFIRLPYDSLYVMRENNYFVIKVFQKLNIDFMEQTYQILSKFN